jgi:hypothetical protein
MRSLVRRAVRAAVGGAGLITVITLGLAACGQATAPAPAATSSRPAPSSSSATSARATTPPAPSAAGQLAAFIAAAEQADSQVRHAAALVNSDIGATSMRFTPAALAAVRALSNAPVARAIPAGLPDELLRETLAVYGDLASRTAALGGVGRYSYSGRALPIGGQEARAVLGCLRHGAPAAARFGADLAALRSAAQQTPPLTLAAPGSRAAAEVALRVNSIDKPNICSDECGGFAPAQLQTVIWHPGSGQHSRHYEGTIGGIRFQADYTAAHGWEINIYAC